MAKHRRLRAKALASRWRWPLLFGGGAALLFLINAKRATASSNPVGAAIPPSAPRIGPAQSVLPIQAGTQNIPELPAVMAPTTMMTQASNSLWDTLAPVDSLPSGYINFPSGAQSAATLFPTRMDDQGNYYVQWAGLVYVLGSQDSSGNWPAQAL